MNNKTLQAGKEMKLLRVILDSELNMNKYYNYLINEEKNK